MPEHFAPLDDAVIAPWLYGNASCTVRQSASESDLHDYCSNNEYVYQTRSRQTSTEWITE
ncbi:hypothetical protein WA016_01371 [Myxococcus stipitatus]